MESATRFVDAQGGVINRGIFYREKMNYQKVTGCLSQGAHPGSYNGQDAYNDMLVIDGNHNNKPQRYADQGGNEWDSRFACGIGLQRPADSSSAEREREREYGR